MTEVSERYAHLSRLFAERLAQVPDDAWGNQSPCEDWTARDVAKHVIDALAGVLPDAGLTPLEDGDDPVAKYETARQAMIAALEDPERASASAPGPMGPMPLETLAGRLLSMDTLVHTWDLSRAAGLDETLDADAVSHAFEGIRPLDAMIRRPGVFGQKVDCPEDADEQTRFLSFLGRKV